MSSNEDTKSLVISPPTAPLVFVVPTGGTSYQLDEDEWDDNWITISSEGGTIYFSITRGSSVAVDPATVSQSGPPVAPSVAGTECLHLPNGAEKTYSLSEIKGTGDFFLNARSEATGPFFLRFDRSSGPK